MNKFGITITDYNDICISWGTNSLKELVNEVIKFCRDNNNKKITINKQGVLNDKRKNP